MKRPRTSAQLIEHLDEELAWRGHEIAALRGSIQGARARAQSALLRASIPLLYAHWEGFVKIASAQYCSYISSLGLKYGAVNVSFSGMAALISVRALTEIRRKLFTAVTLLESIRSIDQRNVELHLQQHLDRVGNLNHALFSEVVEFLALDPTPYEGVRVLIDEDLLAQRNEIAHGERLELSEGDFLRISNEVLAVMRQFMTDIQNAAVLGSYRRAA